MKKKSLHKDKIEIAITLILVMSAIFYLKCCRADNNKSVADDAQTAEMIHYQQSQGRFAVEENGYINIRQ